MTSVKGHAVTDSDRPHVATLLGALMGQVRDAVGDDLDGLRLSHLRVLGCVPPTGSTTTALAAACGMTKQGCGQLVAHLVDTGHLAREQDARDARVRRVRPTPAGTEALRRLASQLDDLEQRWAAVVGDAYPGFRATLEALGAPAAPELRGRTA